METYFGGQILKECRGDLVAIIAKTKENKRGTFLYSYGSEEYLYLTGIGSVNNEVERVYIGINSEIGKSICSIVGGVEDLEEIDKFLVIPYFLRKKEIKKV
jgi:hypothetical protein